MKWEWEHPHRCRDGEKGMGEGGKGIEPGIIREPCMVTCACNPSACEVGDDRLASGTQFMVSKVNKIQTNIKPQTVLCVGNYPKDS